jgi:hypothetical protein
LVASNDDGDVLDNGESLVSLVAVEGTLYRIAVDGFEGDQGHVVLNWGAPATNDHFSAAVVLTGSSGGTTGRNLDATKEPGEPDHAGDLGGASVWWQWTAPETTNVSFDTFGSSFDTLLAVYTGASAGNLTEIASSDDFGDDYRSRVQFGAVAGTTYRVAVDGFDGEVGTIALNWSPSFGPPEVLRLELMSAQIPGAFRFMVYGPPGTAGWIQRGSDPGALADWTPFSLGDLPLEITDPETSSDPTRFYRAVSP